jgi:KipI family sensor histidine kinase inhibitor
MMPQSVSDPSGAAAAPRFLNAGETALVVEFGDSVDPLVHDRVLALDAALRATPPAGTREFVPTYRSLMIHYDPLQIDRDRLIGIVRRMAATSAQSTAEAASWILPCCYDPALAEDLVEAAHLLNLAPQDVVARQMAAAYRVYMYGFAPGYAYLGGLPAALAISRRASPRPPHPPGAVLIGGGLCGVATFAMPTGWYVIGRTPERLYAAERADAFFIQAGDGLRFETIDAATFHALAQRTASGEMIARRAIA